MVNWIEIFSRHFSVFKDIGISRSKDSILDIYNNKYISSML